VADLGTDAGHILTSVDAGIHNYIANLKSANHLPGGQARMLESL
jgi:hypothetical protein